MLIHAFRVRLGPLGGCNGREDPPV
jgi:hypothetical protein